MFLAITLGDIIGYIVTIISVGVGVAVTVRLNISVKKESKKMNQSKSTVGGDQIGENKIGGENNDKWNQSK